MSKFKVAAVHAAPVFLDRQATLDKVCSLVAKAGEQDIRLAVFPEVFVPGFPYWINLYPPLAQGPLNGRYVQESIEVPGADVDLVCAAARDAGTAVVLGVSERDGGTCYNTQVFIDADGTYLGKHRKLQPTYAERYIWGQGDGSTLSVWDSAVGRIGGLACWENMLNLARQALIIDRMQIHASAWPALSTLAGFEDVFEPQVDAVSRAHAITGQCFVIVASDTVTEEMLQTIEEALGPQEMLKAGGGWSAIIHPWGVFVVGPHRGEEEKLVVAEIDLDEIAAVKAFVDTAGHSSRPEILQLRVDREAKTGLVEDKTPDRN